MFIGDEGTSLMRVLGCRIPKLAVSLSASCQHVLTDKRCNPNRTDAKAASGARVRNRCEATKPKPSNRTSQTPKTHLLNHTNAPQTLNLNLTPTSLKHNTYDPFGTLRCQNFGRPYSQKQYHRSWLLWLNACLGLNW